MAVASSQHCSDESTRLRTCDRDRFEADTGVPLRADVLIGFAPPASQGPPIPRNTDKHDLVGLKRYVWGPAVWQLNSDSAHAWRLAPGCGGFVPRDHAGQPCCSPCVKWMLPAPRQVVRIGLQTPVCKALTVEQTAPRMDLYCALIMILYELQLARHKGAQ